MLDFSTFSIPLGILFKTQLEMEIHTQSENEIVSDILKFMFIN